LNDVCYIKCNSGFDIVGSYSRTCTQAGTWSDNDALCLNKYYVCPKINAPANGKIASSCFNYAGGVCKFECNPGFKLVGSKTTVCTISNTWTENVPVCESVNCPQIKAPENGQIVGNVCPSTEGSSCQFQCNNGFQLVGQSYIKCEKVKWSSSVPKCEPLCPTLNPPRNGFISGNCTGITNEKCKFSCLNGFNLYGASSVTCLPNGQWSSNVPSCQRPMCPDINPIKHGMISGRCSFASNGAKCNFFCLPSYRLVGVKQVTCVGQNWSSVFPSCVPITCPLLQPPERGKFIGSCVKNPLGSSCTFTCDIGYILVGQRTIKCTANGWSAPPPTCKEVTCPSIKEFKNGFTKVGNSTLICQADGKWTSPQPTCAPIKCPSLITPISGSMTGTCSGEISSGQICSFSCNSCYNLVGLKSLTCENGAWNGEPPKCELVSCSKLTPPSNSLMNGQCDPG
ncbi:P-selectin-like isoform X1, partial [Dinothrombium tinctorium]